MKHEDVQTLTGNFESFVHTLENGLEFWFARDLQHLLGYGKWDNFLNVISKAKTSLEASGEEVENHFADIGKMVQLGLGSQREILV